MMDIGETGIFQEYATYSITVIVRIAEQQLLSLNDEYIHFLVHCRVAQLLREDVGYLEIYLLYQITGM